MDTSLAPWLVIGLAFVLASLPFVTERLFGVVSLPARKHLGWHLIELLAYYLVVGLAGMALERRAGQIAPQGWEFYAITVALFLTLAFPGFVYRYLWRHRA